MPWIQLLLAVEPAVPGIIASLKALFAKHPELSDPEAQAAFVAALGKAAADASDEALALIAADQAKHK